MLRTGRVQVVLLVALWGMTAGCSKPTEEGAPAAGEPTAHSEAAPTEIAKSIAELPEAERAVATAQKLCPVSDHELGSMGMPYKVTVKETDVYLCCEGCKERLEADPDKYLAKVPQTATK